MTLFFIYKLITKNKTKGVNIYELLFKNGQKGRNGIKNI